MELAEIKRKALSKYKRADELAYRLASLEIPELANSGKNAKNKREVVGGLPIVETEPRRKKNNKNSSINKTNNPKKKSGIKKRGPITDKTLEAILDEYVSGPMLDLRPHFEILTEQLLWELGTICEDVVSINCSGWQTITIAAIRSIALGFGDRLEELDLSDTSVTENMIMTLAARFYKLRKISFHKCTKISDGTMRYVSQGCHTTLRELDVSECPTISGDCFGIIAGTLGLSSLPCKYLETVSMENCWQLRDDSLFALGKGCPNLKHFNANGCRQLTDNGFLRLVQGCKKLQVLHVKGCSSLTDAVLTAIGQNCHQMASLNFGGCTAISDIGLRGLGSGVTTLQALNLSGCSKLTELGIFHVVQRNSALQILNVTGCEFVTDRGLREMLRGMEFVELADTYTGFRPITKIVEKKIDAQTRIVLDDYACTVTAVIRGQATRNRLKRQKLLETHIRCAIYIQRYVRRLLAQRRLQELRNIQRRRQSAVIVQSIFRRAHALRLVEKRKQEVNRDGQNLLRFIDLQAWWRGWQSRKCYADAYHHICTFRQNRIDEVHTAIVIRVQAIFRSRQSNKKLALIRDHLVKQLARRNAAATTIQAIVRCKLAKLYFARYVEWFQRMFAFRICATVSLQSFWRGCQGRQVYRGVLSRHLAYEKLKFDAATNLQKIYRGNRDRDVYKKMYNDFTRRKNAATGFQKTFRGSRVAAWREIKLQRSVAHVQERRKMLEDEAESTVKRLMQGKQQGIDHDSASEDEMIHGDYDPGAQEDDDWQEHWDPTHQKTFYFSPSRNERVWEKYTTDEYETSIIGMWVRVLVPQTNAWHEGKIITYNPRKHKHKIELVEPFNTKGHVWVDMKAREAEVQIYDGATSTWSMYHFYRVQHQKK